MNGLLVDNQNEHNSGDVIENRLLWPSVQRNDLNSVFTCQALNTQLDKPKEKSFILDMHCEFHFEISTRPLANKFVLKHSVTSGENLFGSPQSPTVR